jgi:adenylate kinase
MSLNLFIIGPSGCGKSTQAQLIAEKYGLTHLSVGQILRNEIASASELGLKAKSFIDNGNLVPDEIAFPIITLNLVKINNQNFIIDGFPRVLDQGQFIENYLISQGYPISLIIHLDVTFEEIQTRRDKLGINFQDQDRTDSTPEAIAARQKFYDDNNGSIVDYFKSKNILFEIDGNRSIEPIFQDISDKIDKLK